MQKTIIKEYFQDLVNLVFPNVCVNCSTILVYQEEHLCTACRLSLPKTEYHHQKENPLFQKFVYEPKVKTVSAYLHFNRYGIAQHLIHELKYNSKPQLGNMLGQWYARDLKKLDQKLDFIIPVPLHKSKLEKRGYNQSEHIALGMADILEVPVEADIAKRVKRTSTQTKKSKVQRWQNLESVYQIEDSSKLEGANILVVDDVLTTGATIGQLVGEICKFSVNEIHIATIAAGK